MESAYLISEDEYVRANKLFTRLGREQKTYYAFAVFVLIGLALFGQSSILQFAALFALIGGIIGHLVARHAIAPWQTRRQYREYRAAHESLGIRLEDSGLRFTGQNTDSLLKWENLMKWRENREFVLVYQNSRLYHIIPKRLSSDGFDVSALVSKLVGVVGNST